MMIEANGGSRIIFSPLRPVLSSSATSFDQWLFRSQLDCFSPLLGAVVALQQHRIREALQWLDAQVRGGGEEREGEEGEEREERDEMRGERERMEREREEGGGGDRREKKIE